MDPGVPSRHPRVGQHHVAIVGTTQGDGAGREDDAPFWRSRLTDDEFDLPHVIHRPTAPAGILPGRPRSREGRAKTGAVNHRGVRLNHKASAPALTIKASTRMMPTPSAAYGTREPVRRAGGCDGVSTGRGGAEDSRSVSTTRNT